MNKVEMIIEYSTDGTDYQYNDNHGLLVRCKDCKYAREEYGFFCTRNITMSAITSNDYCSKAEKR